MGRTFNISPQAFFQVNTLGAELLYKTVGDVLGKIIDYDYLI